MTVAAVTESLRTAWERGVQPSAPKANLQGATLRRAALGRADLSGADLRDADLRGADLSGADLSGADLRYADLRGANLWGADLWGADLWRADLSGANLSAANLSAANLLGANLSGANLLGTHGGLLQVTGLHPYLAAFVPTVDGWWLTIGCWSGTADDLRTMIAQDDGWPEARGDEITRRRPLLYVLADVCDAHAAAHKDDLQAVTDVWGRP